MALTAAVLKKTSSGGAITALFSIVASGSYATGGDPLDFAPLVGYTNRQPSFVDINGKAGFEYKYDLANKKMFVYCNTAGGANAALGEHTAATYAAGVSGDTIVAMAIWIPL
jgi:hypothetical protein